MFKVVLRIVLQTIFTQNKTLCVINKKLMIKNKLESTLSNSTQETDSTSLITSLHAINYSSKCVY